MRGSCWRMQTKLTTASLSNATDHFFRRPEMLAWEKWTTTLRLCCSFLKNGKEPMVNEALEQLEKTKGVVEQHWPSHTQVKKDVFCSKLHSFLNMPTIPVSKWLLQMVQKLGRDKSYEFRKDSDDKFQQSLCSACTTHGASVGHKIVRTMVQDRTILYQQVEIQAEQQQGVTIAEMHHSRTCKWAFGKLAVHSPDEHLQLAEAMDKLYKLLREPPRLPKHKLATSGKH